MREGEMASGVAFLLATEREARRRLQEGAFRRSTRRRSEASAELAPKPPTPFHAISPKRISTGANAACRRLDTLVVYKTKRLTLQDSARKIYLFINADN